MIFLSLAVALCFSLPSCLPSVLPQASGLPLLRGHPGTPVSLATHACARVQSECLVSGILVALTQDSPVLLSRHGHPQVSPGSFPVSACGPRRDRPPVHLFRILSLDRGVLDKSVPFGDTASWDF